MAKLKTSMRVILFLSLLLSTLLTFSQGQVRGVVKANNAPLPGANVYILEEKTGTISDLNGEFLLSIKNREERTLRISYVGYKTVTLKLSASSFQKPIIIKLVENSDLNEVVITGNLREMRKLDSPIPVELYTKSILTKNPSPNIFESLERVNGVRPQINCNVCNTGDIHINGLEGPYTMILLDGMPIVSGLSTVYGLSGIPNGILEQVEVVKGPSSALYGSEALAGVINVITKLPSDSLSGEIDAYFTSWQELNVDASLNTPLSKKVNLMTGVNHFRYDNPIDNNKDNFTDVTLQNRVSLFNKLQIKRQDKQRLNIATRFFSEERWGGEMQWTKAFSGGDSIYGEHIKTKRAEVIALYDIPRVKGLAFQFSYNNHTQNSFYGTTPYHANQQIGFGQLLYNKQLGGYRIITALASRYSYYDDNTVATEDLEENTVINSPEKTLIPGVFVQVEKALSPRLNLLTGMRVDRHERHGEIFTPRVALKYVLSEHAVLRLNGGTGFRVVNIFTEDHAALTGARELVISKDIKPERSKSINFNYEQNFYSLSGNRFTVDFNSWYTHFDNQIIPDYETNPNQIRYANLENYAVSRGASINFSTVMANGLNALVGVTYTDVYFTEGEEQVKVQPLLSENWSATWTISKRLNKIPLSIDYTGNLYGPMRLPVLGDLDPRPEKSPWWSIQNLNLSWDSPIKNLVLSAGVKNILNFTPAKNSIARAHDPFDKQVVFDGEGNPQQTSENPHALTFDPSYVYAPNQGRRTYVGLNYKF